MFRLSSFFILSFFMSTARNERLELDRRKQYTVERPRPLLPAFLTFHRCLEDFYSCVGDISRFVRRVQTCHLPDAADRLFRHFFVLHLGLGSQNGLGLLRAFGGAHVATRRDRLRPRRLLLPRDSAGHFVTILVGDLDVSQYHRRTRSIRNSVHFLRHL